MKEYKLKINGLLKRIVYDLNASTIFALGGVLGGLFFLYFYGAHVVNPSHTAWLSVGGDLRQHYLGWLFYRPSEWTFPIGVITNLAYPYGIPITFMDSIPLAAIPLKILEGILPATFQYLGIWGLLSYILQGAIGAVIFKRWTNNTIIILLSTIFLVIDPILMQRMFSHTALASHWLILLAIWAFLERGKNISNYWVISIWSAILIMAILIHPYFLPITGIIFLSALVLRHKNGRDTALSILVPILLTIITFWAIGGFTVKESSSDGLGLYAFNLSSFYNPIGWSFFVGSQPIPSFSGETLNYLGAGMLILLPIISAHLILKTRSFSNLINTARRMPVRNYIVLLLLACLTVAAVSPTVQFGSYRLFTLTVPSLVTELWSIFRASARLMWPVHYIIVIGVLAILIKKGKRLSVPLFCTLLFALTVVQYIDIRYSLPAREKHGLFMSYKTGMQDTLPAEEWRSIASNKEHLVYLDTMNPEIFFELAEVAHHYGLTMNDGYFARSPLTKINAFKSNQEALLISGKADTQEHFYITTDQQIIDRIDPAIYSISQIDGYSVIH